MSSSPVVRKRTRIQLENEARICTAALDVFSANGYRGATVDMIANAAGMSKANVLYYFNRKDDIYRAVLEKTLENWLDPLERLDPDGEPIEEIWRYTREKLRLARDAPRASRLFANEILHGAPVIRPFLQNELRDLVSDKCRVIQVWIDEGRLASISPLHLVFLIWSSTQHYADFAAQIELLDQGTDERSFADAESTLRQIIVQGLAPPATASRSVDDTLVEV